MICCLKVTWLSAEGFGKIITFSQFRVESRDFRLKSGKICLEIPSPLLEKEIAVLKTCQVIYIFIYSFSVFWIIINDILVVNSKSKAYLTQVQKDRDERENIVLWKAPLKTLVNFALELVSLLSSLFARLYQARLKCLLISSIFAFLPRDRILFI